MSEKAENTLFQGFWAHRDAVCHLLKDPVLRMTGLELPVFLTLISQKPLKDRGGVQRGVCKNSKHAGTRDP